MFLDILPLIDLLGPSLLRRKLVRFVPTDKIVPANPERLTSFLNSNDFGYEINMIMILILYTRITQNLSKRLFISSHYNVQTSSLTSWQDVRSDGK